MSEKKQRLFDQLLTEDKKAYDEKMIPLIEADVKSSFSEAIRAGEKQKIAIQKNFWSTMFTDLENLDVDRIANEKIRLKRADEKISVIKEMYKDLFDEEI